MTKPVVRKYLDISTGHMTKNDNDILAMNKAKDVLFDPFEYGYRVWVPSKKFAKETYKAMKKAGLSKSFRKIIKWACKKGMDWVAFDRDGTIYSQFKTFDW
jgi:hypothetical protein